MTIMEFNAAKMYQLSVKGDKDSHLASIFHEVKTAIIKCSSQGYQKTAFGFDETVQWASSLLAKKLRNLAFNVTEDEDTGDITVSWNSLYGE